MIFTEGQIFKEAKNRVIKVTRPNGSYTTISYNELDGVSKLENSTAEGIVSSFEYKYNDKGQIVKETATNKDVKSVKEFAYDEYNYDFLEKKLFPYILKLSRDKIPNIRMNCVIILKKMSKFSKNRETLKDISSSLDELKRDRDIEVVNAINDY